MTLFESICVCLKKYADFDGRAGRSEYWWFVLFQLLAGLSIAFLPVPMNLSRPSRYDLLNVFSLAMFVPHIAVATRRLHDSNLNGWAQIISITVIGAVPVIYWLCRAGDAGVNRFGPPIHREPDAVHSQTLEYAESTPIERQIKLSTDGGSHGHGKLEQN